MCSPLSDHRSTEHSSTIQFAQHADSAVADNIRPRRVPSGPSTVRPQREPFGCTHLARAAFMPVAASLRLRTRAGVHRVMPRRSSAAAVDVHRCIDCCASNCHICAFSCPVPLFPWSPLAGTPIPLSADCILSACRASSWRRRSCRSCRQRALLRWLRASAWCSQMSQPQRSIISHPTRLQPSR